MGSEKEARRKADEARKQKERKEAEERQRRINEVMFRDHMRRHHNWP